MLCLCLICGRDSSPRSLSRPSCFSTLLSASLQPYLQFVFHRCTIFWYRPWPLRNSNILPLSFPPDVVLGNASLSFDGESFAWATLALDGEITSMSFSASSYHQSYVFKYGWPWTSESLRIRLVSFLGRAAHPWLSRWLFNHPIRLALLFASFFWRILTQVARSTIHRKLVGRGAL